MFAVRCARTHARQDHLVNRRCRRFMRSVVRFVCNALLCTQANFSTHGSERVQACLSESAWRECARHAKPACASAWHEFALMSLISLISLISRWILPQAKPPMGSPTNPPIDSPSRDSPTSQQMDSLKFSHKSTDAFSHKPTGAFTHKPTNAFSHESTPNNQLQ